MKKIILVISSVILLFSQSVFAEKIVAIVGKQSITDTEIATLKKILTYFEDFEKKPNEDLSKLILNSAISDQVIDNYAAKIGMKLSEFEVDNFIASLAKSKKLETDEFLDHIQNELHISKKDFRKKMRIEVLRSKIVREVVAQDLAVSDEEVTSMVLSTNYKDAILDIQILTSKDNSEKSYKQMYKIRDEIKDCSSLKTLKFGKFAELSEITTRISRLSNVIQSFAKDLPIGVASDVVEDEYLKVIVVCARKIDQFTDEDNINISNFLGNKKLQIKAQKFFQNLRKKEYVKIMK